ncbi:hypothetical protein JMJ35_004645 [Cladonia borealis]|uniref:F-box domain-containing protein n=1 Tax=Cladonia borealis TaxID=184061 RepID=A0AA39R0I8_9LECA|nr:hypothetical protein JMJ35_004645 [Cladonia borealis]
MAILLDLANELLLPILDYLPPIEMVSLAMSCKRINTLAQDNLTLQRQRIKKYQNVTLWGCCRHQTRPHPILLLRDICNDWRVAYYARSLVIECCGSHPTPWVTDSDRSWNETAQAAYLMPLEAEKVKSVLPKITTTVCKMLRMALRWDEAKVNNALDMTEHGARGAILGLLVVSLPTIKSVSLKGYVWRDDLWIDSLKSIIDQQNPHSGSSGASFLMDVSELNLIQQYESRSAMSWSIVPFATLPSLRVIRGASLKSYSIDNNLFADNFGLPPSPVTEIDLQRTHLTTNDIGNVLRYVQVLTRFRYDRQENIYRGAEPGEIFRALLTCASQSLESLALTSATASREPWDEDITESLRGFKVLKELHLPSNASVASKSISNWRSLATEYTPRLVDLLPASIETVRLVGEMTWKEIAPLLLGLPEGKAEYLPKLKEILFKVGRDQGEAHKQTQALAPLDQERGMVIQLNEDEAARYDGHYSGRFFFFSRSTLATQTCQL